ncbi:unnamed protein product [Mytilus edulis]|uniref:Uncharacterized protein n=1 Tax=Mytilus edulis TaxID=6550 RepID=A0A8S3QN54_MYTED|nr:unnamed protein product [Mytilus edulis]
MFPTISPIRCSFALSDNTNYVSKDDDLTIKAYHGLKLYRTALPTILFAVTILMEIKSPTATSANIEQYYSEIVDAILRADMETLPVCLIFIETCYTPISWKEVVSHLFKGGNKSKSDPNYSGISSSVAYQNYLKRGTIYCFTSPSQLSTPITVSPEDII